MSDPATEALARAKHSVCGWPAAKYDRWQLAAAREALRPIRELHHPVVARTYGREGFTVCDHCLNDMGIAEPWPCETALLCYSTEELNHA